MMNDKLLSFLCEINRNYFFFTETVKRFCYIRGNDITSILVCLNDVTQTKHNDVTYTNKTNVTNDVT